MPKEIGDKIRQYREEMGYTQKELAQAIGVSQSVVSAIECNRAQINDEIIDSLLKALDIPAGEKIRLYREARGISQIEFAKMVGTNPSFLSNIETGEVTLSKTMSERISQALGLPPDSLKPILRQKVKKKGKYRKLDVSDLMHEYNSYHSIMVRILHGSQDEFGELFPAILTIKDLYTGEIVAIYGYGKEGELRIEEYGIKWTAYSYNEELIDDEKNEF